MNLHEFYIGKAFDAYEYFGAHMTKEWSAVSSLRTLCGKD